MKKIKRYGILFFLVIMVSCSNVTSGNSTKQENKSTDPGETPSRQSNTTSSSALNYLGYKLGSDSFLKLPLSTSPSKFQIYAYMEGPRPYIKTSFFPKSGNGTLKFDKVTYGLLEMEDENGGIDSAAYHNYVWTNETMSSFTIPSEFRIGAEPEIKTSFNGSEHAFKLNPLPRLNHEVKGEVAQTTLDVNADYSLEFKNDLPKGTIVGFQLFPDVVDSAALDLSKLYIELELTEDASTIVFTKEMMEPVKNELKSVTSGHAEIFSMNYSKHGSFTIDNVVTDVLLYSSSSIRIPMKN